MSTAMITSTVLEVTFWALIVTIYSNVASEILRSYFSKNFAFWNGDINKRGGVNCANAQDDIVLMIVNGFHHLVAGLLCAYGVIAKDPEMWNHGYLLEVGFEVADLFAMVVNGYPFRHDNVKPDVKGGMVFHHLQGLLSCTVVISSGLNNNQHVQEIAFWLLIGAAVSSFFAAWTFTLNVDTQMPLTAGLLWGNILFFTYCRFYVFPKESYLLLQETSDFAGTWMQHALYAAGASLGLFNVVIMTVVIPKGIQVIRRLLDGVTKLETEEVPLSREDRMKMEAVSSVCQSVPSRTSAAPTKPRLSIDGKNLMALRATVKMMQKRSSKLD